MLHPHEGDVGASPLDEPAAVLEAQGDGAGAGGQMESLRGVHLAVPVVLLVQAAQHVEQTQVGSGPHVATQADGGTAAEGTITFSGGTNPDNGDTITIPDAAVRATGTVTLSGAPAANDQVVLDDGTNPAVTFQFEASAGTITQTNVLREVVIGATPAITAANLQQAVENAPVLTIGATVVGATVNLTNSTSGTGGNVAITETDTNNVIAFTGMSGGAASSNVIIYEFDAAVAATGNVALSGIPTDGDQIMIDDGVNPAVTYEWQASSSITETDQYREVITGASATTAIAALINKINTDTPLLAITASAGSGDSADLVNDTAGAHGNVAMTENEAGAVITLTGMSGGADASTVGGSNVAVSIGTTAALTAANLQAAIEAQRLAGNSAVIAALGSGGDPFVTVTNTVAAGSLGNVTITGTGSPATLAGFAGGVDPSAGTPANSLTFAASSPGSWGDGVVVAVTTPSAAVGAGATSYDLSISAPVDSDGTVQVVENYSNLDNTAASARYVTKVLSEGIRGEYAASDYLRATVVATHAPYTGTYTLGQTGLNVAAYTAGLDGITGLVSTDYVGSLSATGVATGLQALRDAELTEFNVLAIPGISHTDVIDAMIETVVERGDAMALIDPPFGLTRDQAVDWHNGDAFAIANSPTVQIDDGHSAMQWPWFEVYSEYLTANIWMPPSTGALEVYARTDNEVGPWRAPAGFQRGTIDGIRLEFNPRRDDRDVLLGDMNRINPISNFASTGLVLFGNRTLLRVNGPLDSVHVLRMLLYAKKAITTAIQYLNFEPNDPVTWRNFVQTVNPILQAIAAERGLEEFSVKCDAETNPSSLRTQKTMRGIVFLTPTSAAEIIEVDFALQSSGTAEFSV